MNLNLDNLRLELKTFVFEYKYDTCYQQLPFHTINVCLKLNFILNCERMN